MLDAHVKILLVEDDEIDVLSVKRALKKSQIINELIIAKDGVEAFEFLKGTNGHDKITRPYLILLDINMPRMNGLEFLEKIRQDKELYDSVVFVLTTSNSDEDKCQAYSKNIAGYILKSNIGNAFNETVSMLDLYWKLVELPA